MAILDNDPRPVLRKELSRVFKNQRVIRAFEKIFDLIPPEFINQQEQIDDILDLIEAITSELSLAPSASGLREQIQAVNQLAQDIQQGPII